MKQDSKGMLIDIDILVLEFPCNCHPGLLFGFSKMGDWSKYPHS